MVVIGYNIYGGNRMTFKEMDRLLKEAGWYYDGARGSHFKYKHKSKNGIVIVPNHKGDIPKGTANAILKQAGLK